MVAYHADLVHTCQETGESWASENYGGAQVSWLQMTRTLA